MFAGQVLFRPCLAGQGLVGGRPVGVVEVVLLLQSVVGLVFQTLLPRRPRKEFVLEAKGLLARLRRPRHSWVYLQPLHALPHPLVVLLHL